MCDTIIHWDVESGLPSIPLFTKWTPELYIKAFGETFSKTPPVNGGRAPSI